MMKLANDLEFFFLNECLFLPRKKILESRFRYQTFMRF